MTTSFQVLFHYCLLFMELQDSGFSKNILRFQYFVNSVKTFVEITGCSYLEITKLRIELRKLPTECAMRSVLCSSFHSQCYREGKYTKTHSLLFYMANFLLPFHILGYVFPGKPYISQFSTIRTVPRSIQNTKCLWLKDLLGCVSHNDNCMAVVG